MLFIRRQYDAPGDGAGGPRRPRVRAAAPRAAGRGPGQRHQPVGGPGGDVRQVARLDPSMLQAVFVTTDLEEAEELRVRWERQLPGVPLVVVESPYRALVGPVVTYLDVLERAWPPGQGVADDDRRPARVRRAPLVGPAALQPGGQAAQDGARGPRAHRDRGRPVPAERAPRGGAAGGWPRRTGSPAAAGRTCVDVHVAVLALVGLAPDGAEEAALGDEPAGVRRAGPAGSRTRGA